MNDVISNGLEIGIFLKNIEDLDIVTKFFILVLFFRKFYVRYFYFFDEILNYEVCNCVCRVLFFELIFDFYVNIGIRLMCNLLERYLCICEFSFIYFRTFGRFERRVVWKFFFFRGEGFLLVFFCWFVFIVVFILDFGSL